MDPYQAVLSRWSGAAPFWDKYRETIRRMFAPVTEALICDAGIGDGQRVLDVGTGPGEPALSIAEAVGSQGRVCGIDPVLEMVAAARRRADECGVRNAGFVMAFADALPYAAGRFDAVVSRFGVMFFPSPVAGVREMLRVLKAGGRLALAVWAAVDDNPFFGAVERVVDRHVESPIRGGDAPDAFRFARPGKLLEVFAEAAVVESRERLLRFRVEARLSAEEFWTLRCEMSERLRERVATLPAERLAVVKGEAIEALRAYCTADGISLPAQVLIVSGRRS